MVGKWPKRKARPGVDEYGRLPLHYAALEGDQKQVRRHLSRGVDVNAQDDNGFTPLQFAVQESKAEVVTILLNAGADPNLTDRHGNCTLSTAIMNSRNDLSIVQMLLDHGADKYIENNYGVSPFSLAASIGGEIEECLKQ